MPINRLNGRVVDMAAAAGDILDTRKLLGVPGTLPPGWRTYSRLGAVEYIPPAGIKNEFTPLSFAANVPRTDNRLMVGGPSGVTALGSPTVVDATHAFEGAKLLRPMAQLRGVAQTTMWATFVDGANVRICRWDGAAWQYLGAIAKTASDDVVAWSLSDSTALVFIVTAADRTLWHLTGTTLATFGATQATLAGGGNWTIASGHTIANSECLARYPATGTLMLGEYGNSSATMLFRLPNGTGTVWGVESFATELAGSDHFHGLVHHVGAARMIFTRGDSQYFSTDADDGVTVRVAGNRYTLPITGEQLTVSGGCCDVGLVDEVVQGGHDGTLQLTVLNTLTGLRKTLGKPFLTKPGADQCFYLTKIGDLIFFANGFQTVTANDASVHCGLFATTDFTDIVQLHMFPTGTYVGNFVQRMEYFGAIGSTLYWYIKTNTTTAYYTMTLPVPVSRTARLIGGISTNLDTSTQAALGAWYPWNASAGFKAEVVTPTVAADGFTARRGTTCMRFRQGTGIKRLVIESDGATAGTNTAWAVTAGKQYTINLSTMFRPEDAIDATQQYDVYVFLWNTEGTPAWQNYGSALPRTGIPLSSKLSQALTWHDHQFIIRVPASVPGAYTFTKMRVHITTTSAATDGPIDFYVGAVEVTESTPPHYWGCVTDKVTASAIERVYGLYRTGAQFAHVLGIQPNWFADYAGDNALPIRSWIIDANNYLSLLWVPRTVKATGTLTTLSTVTVTADAAVFTADMVGDQFVFGTSTQPYTIVTVTDTTHAVLAASAAGESTTDTFTIVSTKGQFQLRKTVTGPTTTNQCVTTDTYFGKNAMIWLVTQVDGTNVRLSVCVAGQAWEHVAAGTSEAGYASAELLLRMGAVGGANVPSMAVLEDRILDTAFVDDAAGKAALEAYVAALAV